MRSDAEIDRDVDGMNDSCARQAHGCTYPHCACRKNSSPIAPKAPTEPKNAAASSGVSAKQALMLLRVARRSGLTDDEWESLRRFISQHEAAAPAASSPEVADKRASDLIARIDNAVTDWNGSQMADEGEPRVILTCGELRAIRAALAGEPAVAADEGRDAAPTDAAEIIERLWSILDDIDTASDMAKGDDKAYRSCVERLQKKRWETGITTDGYALKLPVRPDALDAANANGLAWAVHRWQDEVALRPLVNVHRRTLDDTWRQVIRYFGGDPEKLIGPNHDTLHMQAQEERAWKPPPAKGGESRWADTGAASQDEHQEKQG